VPRKPARVGRLRGDVSAVAFATAGAIGHPEGLLLRHRADGALRVDGEPDVESLVRLRGRSRGSDGCRQVLVQGPVQVRAATGRIAADEGRVNQEEAVAGGR